MVFFLNRIISLTLTIMLDFQNRQIHNPLVSDHLWRVRKDTSFRWSAQRTSGYFEQINYKSRIFLLFLMYPKTNKQQKMKTQIYQDKRGTTQHARLKVATFQNCVGGIRTHNYIRHWVPGEFQDRLMWGRLPSGYSTTIWAEVNQTKGLEFPILFKNTFLFPNVCKRTWQAIRQESSLKGHNVTFLQLFDLSSGIPWLGCKLGSSCWIRNSDVYLSLCSACWRGLVKTFIYVNKNTSKQETAFSPACPTSPVFV